MKNQSSFPNANCPRCGNIIDLDASPESLSSACDRKRSQLSFREQQLVDLVRQAKSNKEIAYELSLTVGSVKEYMHRVFKKVGVRSRTELALWSAGVATQTPSDILF